MNSNVIEINDSNFDKEILTSDLPALIDFWAPWCGPCKAMGPVIDEVADLFAGKIKVGKCNVDDNPVTPGKFVISAIPTFIIFKSGKEVDRMVGYISKMQLQVKLNNLIS